ncbi:MAG: ABC transporter ATP-binding protein NatA [Owenweeksia sp. TMED14]|nr:MAG: ABC transporter ATP-binding protein NatA [Owenweeksia sp. TMED14]
MNAIESFGVDKQYEGHIALHPIDMEIPEGSVFGLLGPNGAGKTTLLRIINQIISPDHGSVNFYGQKIRSSDSHQIGYLPEERGLYKKMKVGEQSMYFAQLKGLSRHEARKRLHWWFKKWGLETWWDKKVEELSKGMAQKIQFITTVLHEPKLLVFDEPFSGLDPINAALIRDEMLRIKKEGSTILLSTHRMESVEELCSHMALLNNGEKILDGSVNEIRESHRNGNFRLSYRSKNPITLSLPGEVIISQNITDFNKGICIAELQSTKLNSSEIISALAPQVDTIRFEEIIPSMNDIFIKSVKK